MENKNLKVEQEIIIKPKSGAIALALFIILGLVAIALIIASVALISVFEFSFILFIMGSVILLVYACIFPFFGFKIVAPNQACVLVLFGKYIGTIKEEGFYYVNPFAQSYNSARVRTGTAPTGLGIYTEGKKVSLKAMTLNNPKQKINDLMGNPVEVGVIVIWQIEDTAKASFNVENYREFVSIQADTTIRDIVRQFPYDASDENTETMTLRASSTEIAELLCSELQKRAHIAGIKIIEARISHLAYAPEIASSMLQRQQAQALIDARKKIVEGAVGMVESALAMLSENQIVDLDEERKAQMVSNLLVVLCSNKDAQPVLNSSNIY